MEKISSFTTNKKLIDSINDIIDNLNNKGAVKDVQINGTSVLDTSTSNANILMKTVNGVTLTGGTGNILVGTVETGSTSPTDSNVSYWINTADTDGELVDELGDSSTNPISQRAVTEALDSKADADDVDTQLDNKVDKSGVTLTGGTYAKVEVNSQGLVTKGINPTTLSDYGITDAIPKFQGEEYSGKALIVGSDGNVGTSSVKTLNGNSLIGSGNIVAGHTWTTTAPSSGKGGANTNTPAVIIENYVDGTSGYRIWSDGYCEQWGRVTYNGEQAVTVTLLKKYANTNYIALKNYGSANGTKMMDNEGSIYSKKNTDTTSTFITKGTSGDTSYSDWFTCGYIS